MAHAHSSTSAAQTRASPNGPGRLDGLSSEKNWRAAAATTFMKSFESAPQVEAA